MSDDLRERLASYEGQRVSVRTLDGFAYQGTLLKVAAGGIVILTAPCITRAILIQNIRGAASQEPA